MREFGRVLVANRGEIALRVIRALKALEIESIAVYSDADVAAMHVTEADRSYRLSGVYPTETYLDIDKIMEAARKSGADAIHPGYGFLSENSNFAHACRENSLKFIGPTAETLETAGNKFACKKIAEQNNVPVIPYSPDPIEDPQEAAKVANEIGYPVLLKTAFGGGGRGIKEAKNRDEVHEAYESSQREAKAAFGRFAAFIEKRLVKPRHIEFQVLATDDSSDIIHLCERECSIQRRYQKLVELSPSPVVDEETRKKVSDYATKVARAVHYSNAGTIEFLRDSETGNFYFLEINSRLQVEHPVTEFVTGVDLVGSQIRVAAGKKLPVKQSDVELRGCAIESRINAEDPLADFAPSSGKIEALHFPGGPGVRVDSALYEGLEITLYYDSLLAKLIAWGDSFDQARRRMIVALDEFKIAGIETTIPFHRQVMTSPLFQEGRMNTSFIEESHVMDNLLSQKATHDEDSFLIAALLLSKNQFSSSERNPSRSSVERRGPQWIRKEGGRFVEPL